MLDLTCMELKVVTLISFVATPKIWKGDLKIRITTFKLYVFI